MSKLDFAFWDAVPEGPPEYQPGEVMAYHPRNFGWVIGELVRRIDGRDAAGSVLGQLRSWFDDERA